MELNQICLEKKKIFIKSEPFVYSTVSNNRKYIEI